MLTRRELLQASSAAALGSLALPTLAQTGKPLKIGFVYVSPVGDAGWTYQHDLGRREMEKALAGKVETKFVENVQEGPDAERVFRDLAASGHKLIYGTSFGFMNYIAKVATQFPDTTFEHATGYKTAKNLGIYNARFYEGRYLCGVVAGRMTKSNILGYVAAFPIPEVLQGINAFIRGARSVNPKAEVRVVWVNSWYDPGKEREAANTLMSQKADVVTHHTDSTAVVQAAEARGRLLHQEREIGPGRHLEERHGVGRHEGRLRASGADESGRPGIGQGRGRQARSRTESRKVPSVHRTCQRSSRQGNRADGPGDER
jgi:simple sugar transport system substrate-binding protein